jgi:pimeloyl-ACP methyl ester carboxylesterase
MRRAWSLGALVLAYMAAAGCGDSKEEEEAYIPVAEWKTCPSPFNQMDECSTLKMPYDLGNVEGEKLDVFVARKKAAGVARGQVWLLQGGPGGTGAVFAARFDDEQTEVERIAEAVPDVDIYVIEHRGVGLSTRLTCPRQPGADGPPEGLEECINALKVSWGPKLPYFSSQAAARDLAAAIDATRAAGQKAFVYGVSYGTYWAIQYLKVRPNDAAGVILDSVATPGNSFFTEFTLQFDPVAEKLAALCAADALCAQKMGPDPWARVRSIMAGVAQGRCLNEQREDEQGVRV